MSIVRLCGSGTLTGIHWVWKILARSESMALAGSLPVPVWKLSAVIVQPVRSICAFASCAIAKMAVAYVGHITARYGCVQS